jgi:hypothetical protein
MTLGLLALWACARGLRGDRRWFVLGGAVVGLATLARNDGILLGVPFALAFGRDLLVDRRARIGWPAAFGCAAAFLGVVAPWAARQLSVFGSVSPSAAGGRVLWITDYTQLYSVSGETTPATFFAQGLGPIIESRLAGFGSAAFIFASVPLLIFLTVFVIVGAAMRWREPLFSPWLTYAAVFFLFSGLVSAVHVPYGTFLHSAVALVPHAYLLAAAGIGDVVGWVARRRRGWDAPRATRVFTIAVVAVLALGAVLGTFRVAEAWRRDATIRAPIVAALRDVPAGDRLMSPDPGAYAYLLERSGVVTPEDPLPVIREVAAAYGVRWLVVEHDHAVAALRPVLRGSERPEWLSGPLATSPLPDAAGTGAALFAVCLEPSDARCDG